MKKHLEYKDEKSHKFWQIEVNGNSFTVTYGKFGANGQSKTKEFENDEKASVEAEKIIKQKLKKGYQEIENSSNIGMNQESKNYAIKLVTEEVLFGFYTKEDMLQSIGDAFYDDDDFDEKWLENEITTRLKKHERDSLSWQRPTDFDRLVKAFDQLSEQKIVALHRAGYTRQDAEDDCLKIIKKLKKKGIQAKGYCYYHTQDLERVISDSKMLLIGYDSYNQKEELTREIANKIVEALKQNGFDVKWNGKLETRIEIQNINWQKTVDNIDYGYKRIKKIMQDDSKEKSTENEIDYFAELVKFDKEFGGESYSQSFWIVNDEGNFFESWLDDVSKEKRKEYSDSVKIFASADGTGARYAFWFTDGNTDKNKAPIICYGSEGYIGIVAENIKDLIKMLSYGCEGMDGSFYHGFDEEDYEDYDNFLAYFLTYVPNFLIFRKWMEDVLGIKPVSIKNLINNEEGESEKIEKLQENAHIKLDEKFDKWQYQFYPDPKEEDKKYYIKQQEKYDKTKTDLLAEIEIKPTGNLYLKLSENEKILEKTDYEQVTIYLEKGLEIEPNNIKLLKKYAKEIEDSNPKKAIELYTKLIKIHPKPEKFYSNIANAYLEDKELENALEFYQKDIIANPVAYGRYSQNYIVDICKELKSKDAITILEDTLKQSKNTGTYLVLYKLYFEKKKYDKATENALNYIKYSDEQADDYTDIAERFLKKDLYIEAEQIFKKAVSRQIWDDRKMWNYNNIGLCNIRIEPSNIDKALKAFMKAYKLDNKEVVIHQNIHLCGMEFYLNKEYTKAKETLEFCLNNFDYDRKETKLVLKKLDKKLGNNKGFFGKLFS